MFLFLFQVQYVSKCLLICKYIVFHNKLFALQNLKQVLINETKHTRIFVYLIHCLGCFYSFQFLVCSKQIDICKQFVVLLIFRLIFRLLIHNPRITNTQPTYFTDRVISCDTEIYIFVRDIDKRHTEAFSQLGKIN